MAKNESKKAFSRPRAQKRRKMLHPTTPSGSDVQKAFYLFPKNSLFGQPKMLALAAIISFAAFSCSGASDSSPIGSQPDDSQPDNSQPDNPQPDDPQPDDPQPDDPQPDDSQPDQPKPRNVLLITADDLGLQVGAYGETLIQTPNIDELAATGARFGVAYVAQPSCSPSRAALFTGMYSHATGHYGLVDTGLALHPELQSATIPNLLKQAGFRTGLIGKLHVAPESSFQFDYRPPVNARVVQEIAERVGDFLSSTTNDQPFFLMVNYLDPHVFPPGEDPSGFLPQVAGIPEEPLPPSAEVIFPWQGTDTEAHRIRTAGYYASVQRLDHGIGLLINTLKEHGRLDDTLIIFIGDHGPPFARAKISLYEAGVRIPFIIVWPGVTQAGQINDAMVSTVDILPTILDAVGQPIPDHVQGESLHDALSVPDYQGRVYLVAEHHFHIKKPFFPQRAIRNERFKLIHNIRAGEVQPILNVDGCTAYSISRQTKYASTPVRTAFDTFSDPPEFELYDLKTDPFEFVNLANDPQNQAVLEELKTALADWRRNTNDPFLEQSVIDDFIAFSLSP